MTAANKIIMPEAPTDDGIREGNRGIEDEQTTDSQSQEGATFNPIMVRFKPYTERIESNVLVLMSGAKRPDAKDPAKVLSLRPDVFVQ